jgi:hypothetical protein
MNGLPSDSFSKENSIITKSSSRQPLFIDPQMQALKWIKANQKSEGKIERFNKKIDNSFLMKEKKNKFLEKEINLVF